jgi:hypothetical protein
MMTLFEKDSLQNSNPDLTPIKNTIDDFKNNAPSLKNISDGISNVDPNKLPNNENQNADEIDSELVPFDTTSN